MINGNAREFIDGLYYGDERFFLFEGNKYFLQGDYMEGKQMLELFIIGNPKVDFEWHAVSSNNEYPVEEFEMRRYSMANPFGRLRK